MKYKLHYDTIGIRDVLGIWIGEGCMGTKCK